LCRIGRRDFYIAIEPNSMPGLDELMQEVDQRMVDYVDALEDAEDKERRAEVLTGLVDRICEVRQATGGIFNRVFQKSASKKIRVTESELEGVKYMIVRDKTGMGPLEPMISDDQIEDISCSGVGPLFIEHKVFGGLKANISFATPDEIDRFVLKLSEKIGRPVTFREPIVDAVLPDGSRVNIVFGGDVSKRGSNFTIRKFSSEPLSLLDLIGFRSLSYEMAAYLSFMLREGQNIFVVGETASGKTTLLNAMTAFIRPNAKIVTIEDTPEVQVPHPNWTRSVVRGSTRDASGASVSMMDLLKASLRQRPDEIIIGEIRGEEGAVAFQAMQTGHACMATFHASSVEKLIQRLTGSPINVPRTYIDILNVVVVTSQVALPNGNPVRRTVSINEIIGYDPSTDSFSLVEIFRWNPYTDEHEFVGHHNSYLLEHVVSPKRGISPNNRRRIYGELEQRAHVLKRLVESGHSGFRDFYSVMAKAYREGFFR
jgi:flagellar protein FlaI